MSQALYRKYRSKTFDEVVGQDHITKTLKSALKSGQISHAYLFTGPRGVGKTSVARILAHAVNDFDPSDESTKLDIIEIDGASNRRIEEIRDLREKARVLPVSGKYKVYIIDEVHMLTREAFNALLKTLEEPPAHTIFILATTEVHKLPETIVSRTQRFTFRPISAGDMSKHLLKVAKAEKIPIETFALDLVAAHGDGSLRDSISMLDQLSSSGQAITVEAINSMLGLPPEEVVEKLHSCVLAGDGSGLVVEIDRIRLLGVNPSLVARSLGDKLRRDILQGSNKSKTLARLLRELLLVPGSLYPSETLEIALLEAAARAAPRETSVNDQPAEEKNMIKETAASQPQETIKTGSTKSINFGALEWAKVISEVKSQNSPLGLALKHAWPKLVGGKLSLIFEFTLYKKKAGSAEAKRTITQAAEKIVGFKPEVELVVDKAAYREANKNKSSGKSSVQSISNIFGEAEVLESS